MTLLDKLPQLPADKANHALYGLAIFTLAYALFGVALALAVLVVFAGGKELYDLLHRDSHTPDVLDFLATVAGGLGGLINILLATHLR